MTSTPVNCAAIMRLTALPPPPPSPITLILAACTGGSSSKSGRRAPSFSLTPSSEGPREGARLRPRGRTASDENSAGWRPSRADLEDVTEESSHEPRQAAHRGGIRRGAGLPGGPRGAAVEREADGGRIDRALDHVGQSADPDRITTPHGLIEDALGELGHALHDRGAAGHNDAGRRRVLEAGPRQPPHHHRAGLLPAP